MIPWDVVLIAGSSTLLWNMDSEFIYGLGASLALRAPSKFQLTRFISCSKVAFNKVDLYSIPYWNIFPRLDLYHDDSGQSS